LIGNDGGEEEYYLDLNDPACTIFKFDLETGELSPYATGIGDLKMRIAELDCLVVCWGGFLGGVVWVWFGGVFGLVFVGVFGVFVFLGCVGLVVEMNAALLAVEFVKHTIIPNP
jgi:hypothetical protein